MVKKYTRLFGFVFIGVINCLTVYAAGSNGIPVPIGSTGTRGVAIVGINLNEYTKTVNLPPPMSASQVTSIVNNSIASGEIKILSTGLPWTAYFIGQRKCYTAWVYNQPVSDCVHINGDGSITFERYGGYDMYQAAGGPITLSYPSGISPILIAYGVPPFGWPVYVRAEPYGQTIFSNPTGWSVTPY